MAVNKIDREDADPNRVLQQLSEHGLVPEAWGGDTIIVEVSALQDLGIDDLLEQLVVVAEVEELAGQPRRAGPAASSSRPNLEVGRGPVATGHRASGARCGSATPSWPVPRGAR